MYHTEGFVNKHTINIDEHIIMLALEEKGRPWYLWCVVKGTATRKEVVRQALSFWLKQTLLTKGCDGETNAQRELNRLGGYLQNIDPSKLEMEDLELFMYYRGRFYRWSSNGVYGNSYREISKGIYGYVSEDGLWERYSGSEEGDIEPEKLANAWESSLLKACSLGDIEQGFFLIWEDKGDLQKG